jgi:glyoxylase-like metal-dependent hydrolase (beta-lactamase superfamily II)
MIIEKFGKVTDRIVLLGQRESCVYVLDGNGEYALIGGGMIHIIPDVIEQLSALNIDEEKIKRIIVLHAHFDHCGIVSFFKKRWPGAKVTASLRAKELLSTPKVVETIEFLNQVLLAEYGLEDKIKDLGIESYGIDVEEVVAEGDTLSCGDLSLEVIDVPGHSSCSMAVYVPREKAMFASDAGGIPFGDKIFTAANSNFDKYQKSLKKMAGYEIDVFLAEHFGARTGDDARNYLHRSIDSAKDTRKILEESYRRTGNVEKSTEEITVRFMKEVPDGFMSQDLFALVIGQMMNYIAKQM